MLIRATLVLVVVALAVLGWLAFRETPRPSVLRPALVMLQTASVEPFHPPQPGERVRIELLTGAIREGFIRRIDGQSVELQTAHGEVTYPRQHIADSSRRLLFRRDFEGAPANERPATIVDEELARLLSSEDASPDEIGFGRNVQYVISGTNAIIIYRGLE